MAGYRNAALADYIISQTGDPSPACESLRQRSQRELETLMLGWFSNRIFLGIAQARLIRRGVPIFAYHKIAEPTAGMRDPFLYVSPKRFDDQ